mmetsp:Transcript_41492/g.46242  ORF Transcript_41492/g.46242 Transcript_41492/m.46242 type:complete len:86 (-) Transcript_41492:4-261(-)
MPKRPVSAYNIFCREERQRCMATMNMNRNAATMTHNRQQPEQAVAVVGPPIPRIKKMQFFERYSKEMIVYQFEKSNVNRKKMIWE